MCKYNFLAWEWIEVCLMEVSAMLYKCTYCVFTLYGRGEHGEYAIGKGNTDEGIQLKSDKVETKCGLRQILTIIGVYVTYVHVCKRMLRFELQIKL